MKKLEELSRLSFGAQKEFIKNSPFRPLGLPIEAIQI